MTVFFFKDTQQNRVRHSGKMPSQQNEETTKVAETHRADVDFTRHVVEFGRSGEKRATRCCPLVCRTAHSKDYSQSYFFLQTTSKNVCFRSWTRNYLSVLKFIANYLQHSLLVLLSEFLSSLRVACVCVSREYSYMLSEAGYHLLGGFLR